jgi:hypothetical protein
MESLDGKTVDLAKYRGKVLLIINVASECGYTPQYKGLQALHEKYAKDGLAVLGVPCNQFGKQEPGSAKEIAAFCKKNYGVTFDMFDKVDVNGKDARVVDFLVVASGIEILDARVGVEGDDPVAQSMKLSQGVSLFGGNLGSQQQRLPIRVHAPRDTPMYDLLQAHQSVLTASFTAAAASSAYFGFNSMPRQRRPSVAATTQVVPDPTKGSSTKSFGPLHASMI